MTERYNPTIPVRKQDIFWKTTDQPEVVVAFGHPAIFRLVRWRLGPHTFTRCVLLWVIRWYWGTAKIDATQTWRMRMEEPIGSPYEEGYVYTTNPDELWAFRLHGSRLGEEEWVSWGSI